MTFQEALAAGKVTQQQAFEIFDGLPPMNAEDMLGTWRGAGFPSGHVTDGMLEASGWFGKRFQDAETVDPLVFLTSDGTGVFAGDPVKVTGLTRKGLRGKVGEHQAEVETDRPAARLRTVRYRGQDTATMIYDQLPICDHFRKVDDDTVLGAMDARGDSQTYFFVLHRQG